MRGFTGFFGDDTFWAVRDLRRAVADSERPLSERAVAELLACSGTRRWWPRRSCAAGSTLVPEMHRGEPGPGARWSRPRRRCGCRATRPENKPSQGVVHDLWAKALALEDPTGQPRTSDHAGRLRDRPRAFEPRSRRDSDRGYGLERDQIVLACSHTHSGPVVGNNLLAMYKLDAAAGRAGSPTTPSFSSRRCIQISEQAIEPPGRARLSWGNGRCDFAVNRRANKEAEVPALRERLELKGPVDHDVPVLRIDRGRRQLLAAIFGYACHCTVLDGYEFCGDYAGFAQIEHRVASFRRPGDVRRGLRRRSEPDPAAIARPGSPVRQGAGRELRRGAGRTARADRRRAQLDLRRDRAARSPPCPRAEQIEHDAKSSNFFTASRARLLLETIEAAAGRSRRRIRTRCRSGGWAS